ncbi:hypothetical protein M404DRAFT_999187 [Pisolithus tinctorius Marx 270]|uniref:Uncharacterized protein n=1 Tax=Pisolithus tinctorius Marx 270 TaxID=870435 RepID=A0A0C3NYR5_PISTI|nr:hypothetical protein M404DRAFT_999187 [Pisolithus tinctorius Marx 270]
MSNDRPRCHPTLRAVPMPYCQLYHQNRGCPKPLRKVKDGTGGEQLLNMSNTLQRPMRYHLSS